MTPSSALCRAQEALHHRRAADTQLDNVRAVATNAALVWGREALAAELRESRQAVARLPIDTAAPCVAQHAAPGDAASNENPDRGLATAARAAWAGTGACAATPAVRGC